MSIQISITKSCWRLLNHQAWPGTLKEWIMTAKVNKSKKNTRKSSTKKNRYGLKLIHADITLRSASGRSIHEKKVKINSDTIREFYPPEGISKIVESIVESMGLRIVTRNRITICIAAPIDEFEKIFNLKLEKRRFFPYAVPEEQRVPDSKGCGIDILYKKGKKLPIPKQLQGLVDSIHLAVPALFCQSSDPPNPSYFHLKVPDDVARLVDAVQCHQKGIDGSGVRLVMPDQGTFDHPYYTARGYNITLDETAYDDTAENGSHGTAIAANALAVAPGVEFIGIRNGKKISSATAAFLKSVEYNPDVITISWGTTKDVPDLRAAIIQAIVDGITICCACGNGGTLVFPSSIPELISVGGTYSNDTDSFEASTYSSSGTIAVDSGRQMPDMTGFVGQSPKGIYITLPCHSGSDEDKAFGGSSFPDHDETTDNDGWLVASGTSSATPQVAAVACLLIQSNPSFRGQPALIKQRLMQTAVDVTVGSSANGEAAGVGTDNATGTGVVDAFIAMNRVDIWMKDNSIDRGLVRSRGAHWVSPDIKVVDSVLANPNNDFAAAVHENRPVFGTDYYVYIKARNRGVDQANSVTAGFYYADPSTFNAFPADWKDGQSGNPMNGTITVDGNPTNQFFITSIPAKDSRVAGPFVWSPPLPTSATQVENTPDGKKRGHFCLLARLECAADPIMHPGGSQATVWLDNNIGMKNLWVVESDMVFPLTLGGHKWDARKMGLDISMKSIPKNFVFQLRIPKSVVDPGTLKKLKYRQSKTQKGVIYILLAGGRFHYIGLRTNEPVPMQGRIIPSRTFVRGISHKREVREPDIRIDIAHVLDDSIIGGASIALNLKRFLKRK